jgi:hypothetical protein
MEAYFQRQEQAIVGHIPEKRAAPAVKPVRADPQGKASADEVFDLRRWNRELGADIYRLSVATATVWAQYVTDELDSDEFDEERMLPWLEENSRIAAEEINATTRDALGQALTEEKPRSAVQDLFALAIAVRAAEIAVSRVTTTATFGSQEGARQGGLGTKTWQVNSGNPRDSHAALDGETVGIEETFSNGMKWPGDPAGGADEVANCQCSVTFGR